jgi:hypothetical protein
MEQEDFELIDSQLETMTDSEIVAFIKAHTHDLTTCDYCNWIYEEDPPQSIIGDLLDRYELGLLSTPEPSDKVIVAMCNAVGTIWETVETWDVGLLAMNDLMRLTLFPACRAECYEMIVAGFDWTFFRDHEWDFDEITDFLRARASLPNATDKFIKGILNEFHMNPEFHMNHGGGSGYLNDCEECQTLLREFAK